VEGFKMQCPKCQFESPEGSTFCGDCGAPLELSCPSCGSNPPPGFKFCNNCGHDLRIPSEELPKDISFNKKIEKIQKYLPKGLSEKILSQKDRIEGERRHVTVMFCDMEGFTQLTEKLGPDDAYTIMDQVYEILIHKVHDFEGTVNEMTGDGIMALYGAPIALEDAPQRAIRSSLSIHREMAKFSDELKQKKDIIPPLKMRIGIHTGPVVVGTLGNDLRVEFKAVGDTVNLASRMEKMAEPTTTYVTDETFRLTEGLFRFEALGEKKIKGKQEPVMIYQVIAPSSRRTRFDVSAERGLTPFVGRDRELELLLDGFGRIKEGRGQAFSIMAEAGLGKSRLLYEFRKAIVNENVTFLEGKCLSYSRSVAYHPIIDLFKSSFDISEGDGDSEIMGKVKKGLKLVTIDEASGLPYLLELLSVKGSGVDQMRMSPETRKDWMIETMIRITLKGSESRPLIMLVEDLHWIDKNSEDALKSLLESISGARILLIFTYRPEFVHTWGGRSYHNQINLNRLSNRESLAMSSYLLDDAEIERDLENLILEKTEGVPFFLEEFVRSLKDLKVIERKNNRYLPTKNIQDLSIPSTIQDVIMARVDSLSDMAKEILQTGSVIEREFGYNLILRVTRFSEKELLSNLSVLKDSELLFERGVFPESVFIFKHAVTREVIYGSILTPKKKKLHEQIGEALEELYKENINEHYVALAEHFIEGESYEKGADYSKRAAKKARKESAYSDAILYANKEVFCIDRLPENAAKQKRIIDARTNLANYCLSLNKHVEAKEAVEPINELARKMNYKECFPSIDIAIGSYVAFVAEDYSNGIEYLGKAIKLSKELNDYYSLWLASYFSGSALFQICEFEKALNCLKEPLELSITADNRSGISILKSTICSLFYVYQGKLDLAYQDSKLSIQMAEDSRDLRTMGIAYFSLGNCCYFKGLFDQVEKNLSKAISFFEKASHFIWWAWALEILGHLFFDSGKYRIAQDYYNKAISFLEISQTWPSTIEYFKVAKIRAQILVGDNVVNINELYKSYQKNKIKVFEGWIAAHIAEILFLIDGKHMLDAEDWINRAIEADKRNHLTWYLGSDYAFYAKLLKRKGDKLKAKENLIRAIEIFKECGADGWVEKYKKELVELS